MASYLRPTIILNRHSCFSGSITEIPGKLRRLLLNCSLLKIAWVRTIDRFCTMTYYCIKPQLDPNLNPKTTTLLKRLVHFLILRKSGWRSEKKTPANFRILFSQKEFSLSRQSILTKLIMRNSINYQLVTSFTVLLFLFCIRKCTTIKITISSYYIPCNSIKSVVSDEIIISLKRYRS